MKLLKWRGLLRYKIKQPRYTPWRCLGGEEYSSYSFTTSALDGVSGKRHARAATPGKLLSVMGNNNYIH
jgi:hypothetical protein